MKTEDLKVGDKVFTAVMRGGCPEVLEVEVAGVSRSSITFVGQGVSFSMYRMVEQRAMGRTRLEALAAQRKMLLANVLLASEALERATKALTNLDTLIAVERGD